MFQEWLVNGLKVHARPVAKTMIFKQC